MADPRRILLSELSSIADSALTAAAAADAAMDVVVAVSPIQIDNPHTAMEVDHVITAQDENRVGQSALVGAVNKQPGAMAEILISILPRLSIKEAAALSGSCSFFHTTLQPDVDKKALYQAIIDDDRERVCKILNSKPWLLLDSPLRHHVIESKFNWRKYELKDETPLAVAAKLCQIEMVELLLRYYDQLATDDQLSDASRQHVITARAAGLMAWPLYTKSENALNEDEIAIPAEYTQLINTLIDVFANERLARNQTDFTHLSDAAEKALHSLLNRLLPETAIEIDEHIDAELFQLAVYQLHIQRFDAFASWEQRNAFYVRVIGLIQTVLSPETAKIFCEGLYNVVESKQSISARAASHKLLCDQPFYRSSRESLTGMAGICYCGCAGRGCDGSVRACGAASGAVPFGKLMSSKTSNLQNLLACRPNENNRSLRG